MRCHIKIQLGTYPQCPQQLQYFAYLFSVFTIFIIKRLTQLYLPNLQFRITLHKNCFFALKGKDLLQQRRHCER